MTGVRGARYDGIADWYDGYNEAAAGSHGAELARLLGPGTGRCLDLGCGTGQYAEVIRSTGRVPVGLDRSADQLRLARRRVPAAVHADAAALPFADAAFPTVVAMWVSTDVDDFGAVLREAARVLRPGGRLVCYGVHPCFNGPCIENRDDGARIVHPTYRAAGWHPAAPWWSPGGVRSRLGMRHVPLADLLTAFPAAGLVIDRVVEPRDEPLPYALAVCAHRPGA
ncbi:MAG: methyltransferase domain-containing protein [Actinobacteria bacterium]|nr:MAG: methyltransferase domain-containing protein [Actinomycetota bacterium]